MIIATKQAAGASQQQEFDGAVAATDAVNAAGGVNGHQLQLIQCDENLNPNQELACVNQAVADKVSAVVGSSLLFDNFKPLVAAHIPAVDQIGLTPTTYNSPVSYPTAAVVAWFAGLAVMASRDHLKTVELAGVDQGASTAACGVAATGLKNEGIQVIGHIVSPLAAADRSADAASAMNGNPGGILLCGGDPYNTPMIKDLRQAGYTGHIFTQDNGVTPKEAASLGSLANGVEVSFAGLPPSDTSNMYVAEMLSDLNKYIPGGAAAVTQDEQLETGWSGVYLFAHAMAHATSFTSQDVITTLNALKGQIQNGTFGGFVGSGTPPWPQYSRLFSASFIPGELKDGKLVATGGFITIPASLLQSA
jgi:ABC-type branched-subunit amino acid transport system substrate-binding protein